MKRLLIIGAIVSALALVWHFGSSYVAIDSCLDSGGAWDYASQNCRHS